MTQEIVQADFLTTWLEEHQDDVVMVGLLDLMRLVARLGQVAEHFGEPYEPDKAQRQMRALKGLIDYGLPLLETALPPEALTIITEEIS